MRAQLDGYFHFDKRQSLSIYSESLIVVYVSLREVCYFNLRMELTAFCFNDCSNGSNAIPATTLSATIIIISPLTYY